METYTKKAKKEFQNVRSHELREYSEQNLINAIDKLGCLEDYEKKFGCPIFFFIRALTEGFFVKGLKDRKHIVDVTGLKEGKLIYGFISGKNFVNISGYGKEWWMRDDHLF